MDKTKRLLKYTWLYMLQPPWRDANPNPDERSAHWGIWFEGWVWTLAGLALGALVSPSLTHAIGLVNTPYEDWLVVAVAVVAGFLVQLVGWVLTLVRIEVVTRQHKHSDPWNGGPYTYFVALPAFVVVFLVPLAGVGYGIYRYLIWVGTGQREVTVAFVGALLIKTFAIPLVKGIVTGALFRWFMKWLRGDKDIPKST